MMHRTIGLRGYYGSLTLTITLVRSSVSQLVRQSDALLNVTEQYRYFYNDCCLSICC